MALPPPDPPDELYSVGPPPDDEPPPRRRQRRSIDDDDEDEVVARVRRTDLNWVERQLRDTSMPVLILCCFCCGIFALVFGIVGLATAKDPDIRQRALIVTIVSATWISVATIIQVAAELAQMNR